MLGTASTTVPLLPGGSTHVTLAVPAGTNLADFYADVDSTNAVAECNELDNHDTVTQAGCVIIF